MVCIHHLALSGRHDIPSSKKAFFAARRLPVPVRPHTGSIGVLDRRWAAGQGTIRTPNEVLRYWLLPVQGRHCIPHFAYVSAYVVTTQAGQLSTRTFQRPISCRPVSKAHAMEAHRACNAVQWRLASTGHARATRKKRTRLSKMAKNGIFGHSTDNFLALSGPTVVAQRCYT